MAFGAFLKASLGEQKVRTVGVTSVVAMDALLSKFFFRLALKSWRGKSRNADATRNNGSRLESAFLMERRAAPPVPREAGASIASTAEFSRSNSRVPGRERLGIGTLHLRPQLLQGTELQLLHCAFGPT